MMGLLAPTRRGFLTGLMAVGIAPAIIRPGVLMRINSNIWLPISPMPDRIGMLTINEITHEFGRLLHNSGRLTPASKRMSSPDEVSTQLHVDFTYISLDRGLPLSEYSKRVLAPAADNLVAHMVQTGLTNISQDGLGKVLGVYETAQTSVGQMGVRGVSDYFIGADRVITRFDVRARK